jgi:hypothetical protein
MNKISVMLISATLVKELKKTNFALNIVHIFCFVFTLVFDLLKAAINLARV